MCYSGGIFDPENNNWGYSWSICALNPTVDDRNHIVLFTLSSAYDLLFDQLTLIFSWIICLKKRVLTEGAFVFHSVSLEVLCFSTSSSDLLFFYFVEMISCENLKWYFKQTPLLINASQENKLPVGNALTGLNILRESSEFNKLQELRQMLYAITERTGLLIEHNQSCVWAAQLQTESVH